MVDKVAEAQVEEPVVETPAEPLDVFAEAFAQITADEPVKKEVMPTDAYKSPAEISPQPVSEEPAGGAKTEEPAKIEEPVKIEEPAKPAGGDDILERLAGVLKKAEAEPQVQQQQPIEEQPQFSREEMTAIEAYIKDFPDVANAEAMIRRVEYKAITSYIFAEVSRELQPLVQMVRTLSERTYLGDLQQAVPDYGDVRDKVIAWTQTQPPYLKAAYDHVIKSGTVGEVTDLIRRYQKETGAAPAAASGGAPEKPALELAPAVKKAVAALAPVGSKRTAVAVPTEPNDFDGAFEQFAKAG